MINERVILAIETSCDETAAAVVGESYNVYSSAVASQIAIHAKWGGVVPGIACKQHAIAINSVVREALETAHVMPTQLEAIAVTAGPGLPGCLAVGVSAAKAFALGWNKPLVAVNHLEGHMFSAELDGSEIEFPAVYLLVSGGHCMLIYASDRGRYKLLGSTKDDSVGEAYDKVARELGYKYPGGPVIDHLATIGKVTYNFPRPIIKNGYDFSFSGLKSAVRRQIERGEVIEEDIAASFVAACMDVLTVKLKKAVKEYMPKSAIVVGGVSKSPVLRSLLDDGSLGDLKIIFPSLKYSTDNAAMIGAAGWWQYIHVGAAPDSLGMMPRLSLSVE